MRLLSALAAVLSVALLSCAPVRGRALLVRARDEEGAPLVGLAVDIDGLLATKTDGEGTARISLGEGPARARIAVSCPEGDRESNPRHVARRADGVAAQLELTFVCRPARRMLVVVVRAPGAAGSVLRADGEPVGTVAADGTLHVALWSAPDSELQLMLDTGGLDVHPKNMLREHRVADRDELLVLDQPQQERSTREEVPLRRLGKGVSHRAFGGRR